MDLKVAVVQAIPSYNYKQWSTTTPKEGLRKKKTHTSFREILQNMINKL